MNNLLPVALSYLNKGWSVIPVASDKKPIIAWKDYQIKRATPEELVKWWTDYPDAQVGIITGQISDLTVIDFESGADLSLVKEETYKVKTGGGGMHVYFKYEKDFKNAVRIFPDIDVRSEGGYIVSAGSATQKGGYIALNSCEVSQMTPETRNVFLGAFKRVLRSDTPEVGSSVYPRTSTEGLVYGGVGKGERNDAMTKFAGSIHAKIHQSLWPSIGLNLFLEANKKNSPPLDQKELRIIWESIGSREVNQNPDGRVFNKKIRTWGQDEPEIDSNNLVQNIDSSEIPDSKETLHVSEVAALQIIDTDHTYPIDMPPFDEALLGGFTAGEIIVVAGLPGSGKTTLLQDWSVTLSSGGQTKTKQLPTLWFSYEVYPKPLWQKFQIMGANVETPLYMPRFNESGEFKWVEEVVEEAVKKWGIRVVAIDHLGFLRPPKGNYANAPEAITYTVRAMRRLAKKLGLIILFQVHVKKTISKIADLSDIKDSSGIAQEADTVFFISREKDTDGLSTSHAKLWLVKNRKTGMTVSAMFDYQFGRYYYNAVETKKESEERKFKKSSSSGANIGIYEDF